MTNQNNLLGTFSLDGIVPAPKDVSKIEDKGTGKHEKISVTNYNCRISKDDNDGMVNDAEKFKAEDAKIKEIIDVKNELESLTFSLRNTITE
ncbi:MAG: hypothetical protein EZS28_030438 [Streblomastix strix]|uniref:Uncharacterized protein n=1 Tax=Streblomastix strix TaxID=222440 RepID=A0A5J4UW73_9EUKA|nr:MAG: hypothetical protein EZS28_030438 [Streblomastix strix]